MLESSQVQEYINFCNRYEEYQFHKLQEVEYYYLSQKKHYLGKTFAAEFAQKLENNKFTRQNFEETSLSAVSTSESTETKNNSNEPNQISSPTYLTTTKSIGECYKDLNLNQIIHIELVETFFHRLVRLLLKDSQLLTYM